MKKLFATATSVLMLVSCTKPDTTLEVEIKMPPHVVAVPGQTISVPYSVVSGTGSVSVTFDVSSDIPSVVVVSDSANPLEGAVDIVMGRSVTSGTAVTLIFSNGYNEFRYKVDFEQEDIKYDGPRVYTLDSYAQKFDFDFLANNQCHIVIPQDAQSWLSVADDADAKAMTQRSLVLDIAANKGFGRSTQLQLVSKSGSVSYSFTLEQEGVESTMSFVSSAKDQLVPFLSGDSVEGRVYWHPNRSGYLTWRSDLRASYSDDSNHTIMVKSLGASSLSFDSLIGISQIDISEF